METSSARASEGLKGRRDVGEQTDALTTCDGVLADDFAAALGGSHVKSIDGRKGKKKGPAWLAFLKL